MKCITECMYCVQSVSFRVNTIEEFIILMHGEIFGFYRGFISIFFFHEENLFLKKYDYKNLELLAITSIFASFETGK